MLPDPRPYFAGFKDPRRETKNKLHRLEDIVMITLCAQLSGIDDWVGTEVFAQEKESWLRQFLPLENGIPSHDTLSDVMGRLNPLEFRQAFIKWVEVALPSLSGEHIALDGKSLRGTKGGDSPVHLMSAFASESRLVLGQVAVPEKSNEITAIPALLSMLEIEGATITIDAMGAQKAIASQIVESGGDYVLMLKNNHPHLYEDVSLWLDEEYDAGRLEVEETLEKGHGRIETRRYALSTHLSWLEAGKDWQGLQAVGIVESCREVGDKCSRERRYYLCSNDDLKAFASYTRRHWSIENSQHWVLDVQFDEDRCRARTDYSAENLALIRRVALNLLRQAGPPTQSIRSKRIRAALSDTFRVEILGFNT